MQQFLKDQLNLIHVKRETHVFIVERFASFNHKESELFKLN